MGQHSTDKPTPRVIQRHCDPDILEASRLAGWSEYASRVIASRLGDSLDALTLVEPVASELDHPDGLSDMAKAASRLADAILNSEVIALVTDHDVDGLTGHAVLLSALMRFGVPKERLLSYVGHRLDEGYGLSAPLTDRIMAADVQPDLLVTADHGSSDEPRIARFTEKGIDVIVTDHHDLPLDGPPKSAYACVTPRHPQSEYPDKTIAGCMVAWLLMCTVRHQLIERGHGEGTDATLADLLDFVALGTIADCVDLGHSRNNRIVVQRGLRQIARQQRPCWAMAFANRWLSYPLGASTCAFGTAPRINSFSRMNDALAGLRWLMSNSMAEAVRHGEMMEAENTARKDIERRLKDEAFEIAARQVAQGRKSIVVWLPQGHPGVQGIVASRVTEAFGRPSVCLSPKVGEAGLVVGSARGVDGVHIREAFQTCADNHPELFRAFGGHPAAGGLTIGETGLETFSTAFEEAILGQLEDGREMGPVIYTDGAMQLSDLNRELVEELATLEPFGRGFEPPLFEMTMRVQKARAVGDGSHWRLVLTDGGRFIEAMWFSATDPGQQPPPLALGATARFCFSVGLSTFRGEERLDVHIRHAAPVGQRQVA